jgi:hypothetical protein
MLVNAPWCASNDPVAKSEEAVNFGGFSWWRFFGVSAFKGRVPQSRSG